MCNPGSWRSKVNEPSGARVLIVDDHILALETTQEILERQGYEVIGRAMKCVQRDLPGGPETE